MSKRTSVLACTHRRVGATTITGVPAQALVLNDDPDDRDRRVITHAPTGMVFMRVEDALLDQALVDVRKWWKSLVPAERRVVREFSLEILAQQASKEFKPEFISGRDYYKPTE